MRPYYQLTRTPMSQKYTPTNYVLYLLAKREYSESELRRKLALKEYSESEIEQVIAKAQANGWQSDERFAASYVRYRAEQGYGPRRLSQELKQKGVPDWIISQALDEAEIDWFALAEKTFEHKRPSFWDIKAKQKMWRYMTSHGFYHDHFSELLEQDYDE